MARSSSRRKRGNHDPRWPQRELAGNTIDFFVKVAGLSFNDAMR